MLLLWKKYISKHYILALIITSVLICSSTSVFAAKVNDGTTQSNIAPERDYKRETMTFPSQKKKNKETQTIEKKKEASPKESALTNSILPMIIMGVIVLGIFLWISLSIIKKILPGGKQLFSSPGIEILGKTHFDSQKYLAIVRVGTRILVVGVSQNGFDQISEITDPEEVTEILSTAKPKTSTGQNLFYKMFQKQVDKREESSRNNKAVAEPLVQDRIHPQGTTESEADQDLLERQERIKKIRDLES